MNKRLEQLLKKREELNAQIQKAKASETVQKRKEDTRRKILMGALVMEMMESGELDKNKLMKRLDGFLTREIDRKLFELPPLDEEKKNNNQPKEPEEIKQVDENPMVEVILEQTPADKKMSIIKVVREVTGLGLKEGKDLVESFPILVIKASQVKASEIKKHLEEAGAKVSLKTLSD